MFWKASANISREKKAHIEDLVTLYRQLHDFCGLELFLEYHNNYADTTLLKTMTGGLTDDFPVTANSWGRVDARDQREYYREVGRSLVQRLDALVFPVRIYLDDWVEYSHDGFTRAALKIGDDSAEAGRLIPDKTNPHMTCLMMALLYKLSHDREGVLDALSNLKLMEYIVEHYIDVRNCRSPPGVTFILDANAAEMGGRIQHMRISPYVAGVIAPGNCLLGLTDICAGEGRPGQVLDYPLKWGVDYDGQRFFFSSQDNALRCELQYPLMSCENALIFKSWVEGLSQVKGWNGSAAEK